MVPRASCGTQSIPYNQEHPVVLSQPRVPQHLDGTCCRSFTMGSSLTRSPRGDHCAPQHPRQLKPWAEGYRGLGCLCPSHRCTGWPWWLVSSAGSGS